MNTETGVVRSNGPGNEQREAMRSMKVLLVEDNPGDARLIAEMVREAAGQGPAAITAAGFPRFHLVWEKKLEHGLARAEEGDVDILLLDLTLPDSSGLDTFTRMHGRMPHMPIIVLSGILDETLALEAVRQGAQDYLVKGRVDTHLLIRAMGYAMERQKAREERERLIRDLEAALSKIKTLKGLIPICAACKKIRDDRGYWNQLEAYIQSHSHAEFSHSYCPECLHSLYGEFLDDESEPAEQTENTKTELTG